MQPVKMYTTAVCPYCIRAKQILKAKDSLTGKYLSGRLKIDVPEKRTAVNPKKMLTLNALHCQLMAKS